MKLTAIYQGDQKPVRAGVYQRQYADGEWLYCYWDNGWSIGGHSPKYAVLKIGIVSQKQNLPWRGVAK